MIRKISPREVSDSRSLGGGCIGQVQLLVLKNGKKVVQKHYQQPLGSKMAKMEVRGLKSLSDRGFRCPRVFNCEGSIIWMEYLEPSRPKDEDFFLFGRELAQWHKVQGSSCGEVEDNFIGSMPQKNKNPKQWNWPTFFKNNRLEFQWGEVQKRNLSCSELDQKMAVMLMRVEELLGVKENCCSLLHGDLWSGNFHFSGGHFYLVDPAIYFGHREADLAMTKLFGGFPESFYRGYNDEWPLLKGYEIRCRIYQLYHNLNHLNIFGGSYLSSVLGDLNAIL
jgi:fructosamine-3-kinase